MPAEGKSRIASSAALRKAVAVAPPLPLAERGRRSATRTLPDPISSPETPGVAGVAGPPATGLPPLSQNFADWQAVSAMSVARQPSTRRPRPSPCHRPPRDKGTLLSKAQIAHYDPTENCPNRQASNPAGGRERMAERQDDDASSRRGY